MTYVETDVLFASHNTCPACDENAVKEEWQVDSFPYGESRRILEALVPIMTCNSCGFTYSDYRADRLRHDAVCEAEGLLRPDEITKVRKDLAMSRREFGIAFGIPSASMERWENGRLLQSKSSDTLLRVLRNKSIALDYDRRSIGQEKLLSSNVIAVNFRPRALDAYQIEGAQIRAERFRLEA